MVVSDGAINVQWNAPTTGGTVASYSVRYRKNNTTTWETRTDITAISTFILSLDAATTYQAADDKR